jgi:flagellar protein FlgJ
MSIFPATDIISDVARAADPGTVKLAIKRLEDIGGEKARQVDLAFSEAESSVATLRGKAQSVTRIDTSAATATRVETLSPTQKFEAFLLQGWLDVILPKEGSGVYGSGAGTGIWRSMMAEQLATQIVRAGGVGLHNILSHKNSSVAV